MLRYSLQPLLTLILKLWLSQNIFELGRNYVHVRHKFVGIQE